MSISIKQLTQMALLAAISIILVFLVRFPIIPIAPFLEYTPGDVPIFVAAFLYKPVAALILGVVTAVLQGITVSAHSGPVGIMMNIFSFGSYVLVASFVYKRLKSNTGIIVAMVAGSVATIVAMIGFNLIFTPIFMGVPREVVVQMILPAILPFNVIRAGVNSVITFVILRVILLYIKPTH